MKTTRGEKGLAVAVGLVTAAVVCLIAFGADWLNGQGWFGGGANVIQWISGPATIGAVAAAAWLRWNRRCGVPWCPRIGEHPVKGTLRKVCHHHHTLHGHETVHDLRGEIHRLSDKLDWGESHQRPVDSAASTPRSRT